MTTKDDEMDDVYLALLRSTIEAVGPEHGVTWPGEDAVADAAVAKIKPVSPAEAAAIIEKYLPHAPGYVVKRREPFPEPGDFVDTTQKFVTPRQFTAFLEKLMPPGSPGRVRREASRRAVALQAERMRALREMNQGGLPSFATGGTVDYGFTEEELAAFGSSPAAPAAPAAPVAAPVMSAAEALQWELAQPVVAAAPATLVADVPAIPATTSLPPAAVVPTVPAIPGRTTIPSTVTSTASAVDDVPAIPGRTTVTIPNAVPVTASAEAKPKPTTNPAVSGSTASPDKTFGFTPQEVAGFSSAAASAAPRPKTTTDAAASGPTVSPSQNPGFTPQEVAGFTSGPAAFSPEVINQVMGLTPGQEQAFLGDQAAFDQTVLDAVLGLTPEEEDAFLGGQAQIDQEVLDMTLGLTPEQRDAFLGSSELVDQDELAGTLAGFTPMQTAGFMSPEAAHSQRALDAALVVTAEDEAAFGDSRAATLSHDELLATMAAQPRFKQDFGPGIQQELQETQARQRQRERLERRQDQLEQFKREFAEADPNHPTSFAPVDPRLEQFRDEFFGKESLETDPNLPSSYAPRIPGTQEELLHQGIEAIRRRWPGFAAIAENLKLEFEDVPAGAERKGPQKGKDPNRPGLILHDAKPFLEGDHLLLGLQAVGSDSAIDGSPAHELTHLVRTWLAENRKEELELLEHGEGGELGPKFRYSDQNGELQECPVGGVEELACRDLSSADPAVREFAELHADRETKNEHLFNYILERPGVIPEHLNEQVEALNAEVPTKNGKT